MISDLGPFSLLLSLISEATILFPLPCEAFSPGLFAHGPPPGPTILMKLLRGEILEEIRPWLVGAKLAALPKPDNTLRPIAVGDTLRRLVGKLAIKELEGLLVLAHHLLRQPLEVGVRRLRLASVHGATNDGRRALSNNL